MANRKTCRRCGTFLDVGDEPICETCDLVVAGELFEIHRQFEDHNLGAAGFDS